MTALVAVKTTTEVPLPGGTRLTFEKEAVTPAGRPVQLSATDELNAPERAVDKLTWAVDAVFRVTVVCAGVRTNVEGGVVTVTGTVIVLVKPLPEAVTCNW